MQLLLLFFAHLLDLLPLHLLLNSPDELFVQDAHPVLVNGLGWLLIAQHMFLEHLGGGPKNLPRPPHRVGR